MREKEKYNSAIAEMVSIIVECLIYNQPLSESLIADNYSASLNKYNIPEKKNFNLVDILQSTILKIQQTSFLTSAQKQDYRDKLNKTISEIKNPFKNSDDQINDLIEQTEKLKKQVDGELFNRENIYSIISLLQHKIKRIKVANIENPKNRYFLKFLGRLSIFLGKTIFYGIIFCAILFICIGVYSKWAMILANFGFR